MSKEDPYRDQAERLRQRIEKINDPSSKKEKLPPRSDLHRNKKKKTKWKLKYPVIRLLVLFFILLPVTIFSVYTYLQDKGSFKQISGDSQGYEMVNLEKSDTVENDKKKKATSSVNQTDAVVSSNDDKKQSVTLVTETAPKLYGQKDTDKNAAPSKKQEGSTSQVSSSPGTKMVYHTVQPQETLFRIAMKYYQSQAGIERIKQANHIQGNEIETGQVLKIPMKN